MDTEEPPARGMRERMLAGEDYIADDPQLAEDHLRAMRSQDAYNQIRVGARTFVNFGLVALDVPTITIGDNVWLGGGVVVLPGVTIGARHRGGRRCSRHP